jgi:hypothetical protein
MIFTKLDAMNRKRRVVFALVVCLSLGFFGGCGGAWQPDPRDRPHDQTLSGVEGSGLNGPMMEDSRTHF